MGFPQATPQGISYQAVAYDSDGFEIQTLKIDSFLFKSLFGCTHSAYAEYDPNATIDDGTCSTIYQFGCTTANPWGLNPINYCDVPQPFPTQFGDLGFCDTETFAEEVQTASDNNDFTTFNSLLSNSCAVATFGAEYVFHHDSFDDCWNQTNPCIPGIEGCMDPMSSYYNPNANIPGNCEDVIIGCMDSTYIDYNAIANSSDPSLCITLIVNGCTDDSFIEYNSEANFDNGSCVNEVVSGCIDDCYFEFNELANTDDESCQTLWLDAYQSLSDEFTLGLSSIQQTLDTWNTTIDLAEGWNMFGYGCPSPIDVAEGLSNHTESINIVKDNNGSVYMPEFGFNGIGDFTPGFGYQIKLTEAIEGFSLCDWYVNDIPEDNIVSLQEENASLVDSLISMHNQNCIEDGSCGFDNVNQICISAEDGYDCNGDILPYVGMEAFGGIVFYIDETGEHGLIAAIQDLTIGATDPYGWGYNGYEWGCYEGSVNGADGTYLGTGYQNTMDIVNQGCATENEGVTAAQAALDAEINSYSDWYLPSIDELSEMYNTICQSSSSGNIGGFNYFNDTAYWSSSESGNNHAKYVRFSDGNLLSDQKYSTRRVRPIRSF